PLFGKLWVVTAMRVSGHRGNVRCAGSKTRRMRERQGREEMRTPLQRIARARAMGGVHLLQISIPSARARSIRGHAANGLSLGVPCAALHAARAERVSCSPVLRFCLALALRAPLLLAVPRYRSAARRILRYASPHPASAPACSDVSFSTGVDKSQSRL